MNLDEIFESFDTKSFKNDGVKTNFLSKIWGKNFTTKIEQGVKSGEFETLCEEFKRVFGKDFKPNFSSENETLLAEFKRIFGKEFKPNLEDEIFDGKKFIFTIEQFISCVKQRQKAMNADIKALLDKANSLKIVRDFEH